MATLANVDVPLWHMSVEKYHATIESGILGPEDRVELLEGVLVEKMSKKPAHTYATRAARQALERIMPSAGLSTLRSRSRWRTASLSLTSPSFEAIPAIMQIVILRGLTSR